MKRLVLLVILAGCASGDLSSGSWKAGVARFKITPAEPMWMSGYGGRNKPAEGALHDLWIKALLLEDPAGARSLILTADLVGIDKDLSDRVCSRIKLPRESIVIACSHTHTGPMVGHNLEAMFDLPEVERNKIAAYAKLLEEAFVAAAIGAQRNLAPAALSWGNGTARFAVNRRNNKEAEVPKLIEQNALKGPVDYDVPVLKVARPDGSLAAVLFGYACHNTVLDFYQWSGDYAGFAQIEVEKAHPDATALFFMGCGADQNPLPRRKVELAAEYGKRLADSVDRALAGSMEPISGALSARMEFLSIPYAEHPDPQAFEKRLKDPKVSERRRAEILLEQKREKGSISSTYEGYPIQVWHLGNGPLVVTLGGEVVVDYSLRLKEELVPGRTWVAGYCNDVMAYIPSERVLKEGGYEGGGSMVYYGLPGAWAPGIEHQIVLHVKELAK